MNEPSQSKGVIPARQVRRLTHPVMIDCGTQSDTGTRNHLTVVPLVDGEHVAGLEIRCSCGASAIVECVYEPEDES